MTPRALAVLIALGSVWGASFLFIKVVVEETSPAALVEGRLFFGFLVVAAMLAYRGGPFRWSTSLLLGVGAMAVFSNIIPFLLIAWAEERIDSGVAAVLNSTMPLFTALFAAVILAEERMTAGRVAGLVLGLLGVVVLTGGDIVHVTDSSVAGQLAVVASAACYGVGAVYARILLRSDDPLSLSAWQLAAGTLLALPVLMVLDGGRPDYSLSVEGWLSLLALGAFGTGFGYVAYVWLVDHAGSVRASLVTYVIPVVGLFLGWAVLNESLGANTLVGAALIIAGVASVMRGQAPASQRALPLAAPEAASAD